MANLFRYLRDPYNQVFRFTAVGNTECHLKINDQIFYSPSEISDLLLSSLHDDYFPTDMDTFSKRVYWLMANQGTQKMFTHGGAGQTLMNNNILHYYNSYPNDICWANPSAAGLILNALYPNQIYPAIFTNDHGSISYKGIAWFDAMLRVLCYKDKYTHASADDCIGDIKHYTEPLRKTSDAAGYNDDLNHADLVEQALPYTTPPYTSATMKMPNTASIVLPVKSNNIPLTDRAEKITIYANAIITIPTGITGDVEMPFTLIQITGTGSVSVNGVTYNLPADEATLKAKLQLHEIWYRNFEVITNTGGITGEFLVSSRFALFNKNYIDLGIISGNLTISRETTATPMLTCPLSVDIKTAEGFTLDFIHQFTRSKALKIPRAVTMIWDKRLVFFKKAGTQKYLSQFLYNYTGNQENVSAGTLVVDQCFAAKLMPRDDSFTGSLELSFTVYDGSTCYYTTDDSTPTVASTKYTVPFTISATTTIKWINIKDGYADSHVNSRVITKTA